MTRAIALAHETGILQWADHLPHPRTDGIEHEVAEMLGKLAACYAAGSDWVLGRLRELMNELEALWQARYGH